MPVINGHLDPAGAFVQVLIGISKTEALQLRNALRPIPPPVQINALVDPGAECTCVDFQQLNILFLPPVGIGLLNVPAISGFTLSSRYAAGITILHPSGNSRENLVIPNLTIEDLPLGRLGYQALIGRDVLNQCVFVYDGPGGKFSLTY